jgi:N-acetylgalactosamine-N,N'-diacetylbacillosaminyl-diphospho-undecaprenol 4-alpha-N-acetylgalactosaminyltransferase
MKAILINSLADGGAEKVVLTIIEAFVKRGHQIKLICLEKNQFYDIPKDVEVIYLSNATGFENGMRKMLQIVLLAVKLKKWVKKLRIEVIQSHLFRANYVNVLAKLMGAGHQSQLVNTVSISAKYAQSGISGKINLLLINLLYPQADCLIAKSEGILHDLNSRFGFSVPTKVIANPTKIHDIRCQQQESMFESEFTFQPNRQYIIAMARMHPHKCLDLLIQSFSIISNNYENTDLILLGDGQEKNKLKEMIANYHLEHRVFLIGRVKNPYKYLVRSNLFVLPSASEGFPNSLIDAMSCKLPVISTDCMSGPREILAPETDIGKQIHRHIEFASFGVLVPVKNHFFLAEAMKKLLCDESLSQQYAEKGYERACMFSLDRIIDQYENVLIQEEYFH